MESNTGITVHAELTVKVRRDDPVQRLECLAEMIGKALI